MPSTSIAGRAIRNTVGVVSCIGRTILGAVPDASARRPRGAYTAPEWTASSPHDAVREHRRGGDLHRRYGEGETAVDALAGVTVDFPAGRFAAIMGPSGSGKSTLMHMLAGLDRPTSGIVRIAGVELTDLDDGALTQLRRDRVGFIFQTFNLLPVLSAEENILLPRRDRRAQARPRLVRHGSSTRSASATASPTARPSCPAASSSASRSPAP